MILTPDQLELFTGKTARAQKRFGSQAVELDHLGIPYAKRSDGTLIVYTRHVENGQAEKTSEQSPALCL